MTDPVAIGLAGQTEQKEQTEFLEDLKGENKCEQTERDVSSGTHQLVIPSRPSHCVFSYCKQQ